MFKIGDVVVGPKDVFNHKDTDKWVVTRVYLENGDEFLSVKNIDSNQCQDWFSWRFKREEDKKTYKQLYEEAKALKIVGRSKLNKKGLEAAIIKQAGVVAEAPVKPVVAPPKPLLEDELKGKMAGKGLAQCSYAIEYESGARNFRIGNVCHAHIVPYAPVSKLALEVESYYEKHKHKELYEQFVDYILNESSIADSFLTKEWRNKPILMNIDKSVSRVATAAIIFRQGWEFPNKLVTWKWFIDKGFSKNVSWFMAQIVLLVNNVWCPSNQGSSHSFLYNEASVKGLFKFFKEGFYTPTNGVYKSGTGGGYSIFNSVATYGPDSLCDWIESRKKVLIIGVGWDAKRVVDEDSLIEMAKEAALSID